MWTYVISKHDMESSWVHSAHISEEVAKQKVEEFNKQEELYLEKYNEWVDAANPEVEPPSKWGDYTYTYNKIWLDGI